MHVVGSACRGQTAHSHDTYPWALLDFSIARLGAVPLDGGIFVAYARMGEVAGVRLPREARSNNNCREGKRRIRKKLREWRRGKGEKDRYRAEKRKYNRLCERKKRKKVRTGLK